MGLFWYPAVVVLAVVLACFCAKGDYWTVHHDRLREAMEAGIRIDTELGRHLPDEDKRWLHGHLDFALGADDWWSHTCPECTPVSQGKGRVLAHEVVAMPTPPTHDCDKTRVVTSRQVPKQRVLPATKQHPPGRYEEADGSITFYYPEAERSAVIQGWSVN
jgi:hypothetical protein